GRIQGTDIRRRHGEGGRDELRHAGHEAAEPRHRLRIAPREFRNRLEGVFFGPVIEQVAPVGERRETRFLRDYFEAVGWQIEISDDLRAEEAAHVRADGETESRIELLRDRRSFEDMTSLEGADFLPREGK